MWAGLIVPVVLLSLRGSCGSSLRVATASWELNPYCEVTSLTPADHLGSEINVYPTFF